MVTDDEETTDAEPEDVDAEEPLDEQEDVETSGQAPSGGQASSDGQAPSGGQGPPGGQGGQAPPQGQEQPPQGGQGQPPQGGQGQPPQGQGQPGQYGGQPYNQGPSTVDQVTAALSTPSSKGHLAYFTALFGVAAFVSGLLFLIVAELSNNAPGPMTFARTTLVVLSVGLGVYFAETLDEDAITVYTLGAVTAATASFVFTLLGNIFVLLNASGTFAPDFADLLVGTILVTLFTAIAGLLGAFLGTRFDPDDMFEPAYPAHGQQPPQGQVPPQGGQQPPEQGRNQDR
jgi:hypothetical protein